MSTAIKGGTIVTADRTYVADVMLKKVSSLILAPAFRVTRHLMPQAVM